MAKRPLARLAFIVAYCAFLFVVVEVSARAFFRILPMAWGRIPGNNSDASWRIRWTQRHAGALPATYTFDDFHPIRGWTLRPSLHDMAVFGAHRLSSDAHGVRGSVEHPFEHQDGIARIVVIGDSFTFGEEVSDDETYAAALEDLLPKTEVLNLGVHGYGHDQMLLYLQEQGLKYRPDVVILGFVEYDVERNILSFRDYAKPRFVLQGDHLALTNVPIPALESVVVAEPYRFKSLDILTILYDELSWDAGPSRHRAEQLTRALLDETARVTLAANAAPVLVYLPVPEEMSGNRPSAGETFMLDYCRRASRVHCLSLLPAFRDRASGRDRGAGEHWTPTEHRLAATAIADFLASEGLAKR